MALYSCEAVIVTSIVVTVEADTPEAAEVKFSAMSAYLWDDYYDSDAYYDVTCDIKTIKEVKTS